MLLRCRLGYERTRNFGARLQAYNAAVSNGELAAVSKEKENTLGVSSHRCMHAHMYRSLETTRPIGLNELMSAVRARGLQYARQSERGLAWRTPMVDFGIRSQTKFTKFSKLHVAPPTSCILRILPLPSQIPTPITLAPFAVTQLPLPSSVACCLVFRQLDLG
jgi:hypothetical protein